MRSDKNYIFDIECKLVPAKPTCEEKILKIRRLL